MRLKTTTADQSRNSRAFNDVSIETLFVDDSERKRKIHLFDSFGHQGMYKQLLSFTISEVIDCFDGYRCNCKT